MKIGRRPLTAISVPFDQLNAPRLTYPKLEEMIQDYFWDDYEEIDELFDRYENSIGQSAAVEWQQQHLLIVAYKLQQAMSDDERILWSNRYTKVSIEIYGEPDSSQALAVAATVKKDLDTASRHYSDDPMLIQPALDVYEALAGEVADEVVEGNYPSHDALLRLIRNYLVDRFDFVYEVLDDYHDDDVLDDHTIRMKYRAMLERLAIDNPAWKQWTVVANESTQMQVFAPLRQVVVGSHILPLPVRRVRSLFTHEVLVHAQRAVRGARYDANLTYGLPGYTTAEEGLGVLLEAAIEGKMPYRVGDRYVDISLALGHHDMPAISRPDLFNIVLARTRLRQAAEGIKIEEIALRRATWQHVNRLYRGSLGNRFIGVYTKDSVYFRGYQQMANYLSNYKGEDFYRALDFVLSGKLNPDNPDHRLYMHKQRFNITEEGGD